MSITSTLDRSESPAPIPAAFLSREGHQFYPGHCGEEKILNSLVSGSEFNLSHITQTPRVSQLRSSPTSSVRRAVTQVSLLHQVIGSFGFQNKYLHTCTTWHVTPHLLGKKLTSLRTWRFIPVLITALHWSVPRSRYVQSKTYSSISIKCIFILHFNYAWVFSVASFLQPFTPKPCMPFSYIRYLPYAPPISFSWFYHPGSLRRGAPIMNFLLLLSPSWIQIFSSPVWFQTPSMYVFPWCERPSVYTGRKYCIFCRLIYTLLQSRK